MIYHIVKTREESSKKKREENPLNTVNWIIKDILERKVKIQIDNWVEMALWTVDLHLCFYLLEFI